MATAQVHRGSTAFWLPDDWDGDVLPWITSVASRHMATLEPPFLLAWYGDRYREFAMNLDWLAHSFVANAEKEAEGARKLAKIAASARGHAFAPRIFAHAKDEARHARMYIAMLKLIFPEALDESSRKQLLASFPVFGALSDWDEPPRALEAILDDIIQMNIGEIRTRLHQMLLRPVAGAACPKANAGSLLDLLQRIHEDEGRHILYTAQILEEQAREGYAAFIDAVYARRVRDFGEITLREVGVGQFD